MTVNCLIAGVGGQGTVLESRLIGDAAIRRGFFVRGSETIGMAQRGGSVTSHIRMGSGEIFSPLIPPGKADLIIAFELAEAVRALPFRAASGSIVVLDKTVKPSGGYDEGTMLAYLKGAVPAEKLFIAGSEALRAAIGGERAFNTALLGFAAAKGLLPFSLEDAREAVKGRVNPRYLALNEKALAAGASL